MKTSLIAFTSLCVMLTGCNPEPQQQSNAPVAVIPAQPPSAPALLPLYEAVAKCLSRCESRWYWLPQESSMAQPIFVPPLPLQFADHVADPEAFERFEAMVTELPPMLQSVGKLGPDDEERTIKTSFGINYKVEKPKLSGHLYNVIFDNQRIVYVYSNVHYMRIEDRKPGSLHVAVDPQTHEYAGVLRGGDNLDEYHVVGSESLRSTLLAYTVAKDLETAEAHAHYARKANGAYETKPIILPLTRNLQEALQRVGLLNERLGEEVEAYGVPAPAFLVQAMAEQASRAWYGVSQERDKCIESPLSPADRIDLIKSAGITPHIRETNSGGQLTTVEVSADDGRYETTWHFFKSKAECERVMVAPTTPDKYR
jgi:hypothetical protein